MEKYTHAGKYDSTFHLVVCAALSGDAECSVLDAAAGAGTLVRSTPESQPLSFQITFLFPY
jgi:predicted RNA methylase